MKFVLIVKLLREKMRNIPNHRHKYLLLFLFITLLKSSIEPNVHDMWMWIFKRAGKEKKWHCKLRFVVSCYFSSFRFSVCVCVFICARISESRLWKWNFFFFLYFAIVHEWKQYLTLVTGAKSHENFKTLEQQGLNFFRHRLCLLCLLFSLHSKRTHKNKLAKRNSSGWQTKITSEKKNEQVTKKFISFALSACRTTPWNVCQPSNS